MLNHVGWSAHLHLQIQGDIYEAQVTKDSYIKYGAQNLPSKHDGISATLITHLYEVKNFSLAQLRNVFLKVSSYCCDFACINTLEQATSIGEQMFL